MLEIGGNVATKTILINGVTEADISQVNFRRTDLGNISCTVNYALKESTGSTFANRNTPVILTQGQKTAMLAMLQDIIRQINSLEGLI